MRETPIDIRKTAEKIAATANECCHRSDGYEEAIRRAIERLLMAERERCAKIAEDFNAEWPNDAHRIADSIRSPSLASQPLEMKEK